MLLSEAIELFDLSMAGVRAEGTRRCYRESFQKLLGFLGSDMLLEDVTLVDLRRWRASIASERKWSTHPNKPTQDVCLSLYTLHRHVRQMRRFFRWCVEDGILPASPADRLELPTLPKDKPPKFIPEEDIFKLLEAAKANPHPRFGFRSYALIRFLADTGCRIGGAVSMRLNDVDLVRGCAVVTEKGNKSRVVFFDEETKAALRSWLVVRQSDSDWFFISQSRGQWSQNGAYQMLKRLAHRAGVPRFNPHSFRHGWAQRALDDGAHLEDVGEVLGHSDIKTTKSFYTIWDNTRRRKTHQRYGKLRPD